MLSTMASFGEGGGNMVVGTVWYGPELVMAGIWCCIAVTAGDRRIGASVPLIGMSS